MKTSLPKNIITIVIADDHKIIKQGIRAVLAFYKDIKIIGDADNGRQLLNMLVQFEPDVVLLDLQMPVMDGMATLPQIRKLYPGIKVIILSMHDNVMMISELLKSGAHSYLKKDSDPGIIYSTIKSCYQEKG